uniref:Uncharacterized protein n=1 Tax=Tanacetum cinerariifolium TaxID=118510 RepID=A0A6L2N3K3_TANCI|nr:hypothetical protein [Tanacetum cinerariifolium]
MVDGAVTALQQKGTSLRQRDLLLSSVAQQRLTTAPGRAELFRAFQFEDKLVDKLLRDNKPLTFYQDGLPIADAETAARFNAAYLAFKSPNDAASDIPEILSFQLPQYVRPALPLTEVKQDIVRGTDPGPLFLVRVRQAAPALPTPVVLPPGDFEPIDFAAADFYVSDSTGNLATLAHAASLTDSGNEEVIVGSKIEEHGQARTNQLTTSGSVATTTLTALPVLTDATLPAIKQAKVFPIFKDAMGEVLRQRYPNLFVPGLAEFPAGGIAVMEVNQAFIEAYMAGLNHAMGSELRWRGFPVDLRGTFFQQFWDVSEHHNTQTAPGSLPTAAAEAALLDVLPLDEWASRPLGQNAPLRSPVTPVIRLVMRSELFRRYPTLVVGLQPSTGLGPNPDPSSMVYPQQRLPIGQDLLVLTFNIALTTATALPAQGGYYLVLMERPGQPQFGLDELAPRVQQGETTVYVPASGTTPASTVTVPYITGPADDPLVWNDLSWEYLGTREGANLSWQYAGTSATGLSGKPRAAAEHESLQYLTDRTAAFAACSTIHDSLSPVLSMSIPVLPALPSGFDSHFPVLLMPVSVQVKFVHDSPTNYELRVRIYPDQIGISTHEGGLTQNERADGEQYWTLGARANPAQPHHIEHWRPLVARYGGPRAQWIVGQTTPTNLTNLTSASPVFPSPAMAPNNERWTRAAEARGLPDRFSVFLYTQASNLNEVAPGSVRDQFYTSPGRAYDPAAIANPTTEFLQLAKVVEGAPITAQPLAVGLGPKSRSQAPGQAEYERGFKRLVIMGVRTTTATDGQQALQSLLTEHYYTSGLHLVPQGTPTNNTDDAASGYNSRERTDADVSFALLQQSRAYTTQAPWITRPDGQHLTGALGLDSTNLPPLAPALDTSTAQAINRALWPATYGYFLEEMLRPLLSADALAWTRAFFENYVLARGAVPTLRVGNQPYGVLPTTRFSAWEVRGPAGPDQTYATELQQVLSRLDATWTERLNAQKGLYPPTLGSGATAAGFPTSTPDSENLLTTLGLDATSTEYYQRYLIGPTLAEALNAYAQATGAPSIWADSQRSAGRVDAADNPLYQDFTRLLDPNGALGLPPTAPTIFGQTFQRTFTKLADAFADEPATRRSEGVLINDQPLSETIAVAPFRGVSITYRDWNYITWLSMASFDEIWREDFSSLVIDTTLFKAPNSLFYYLLRQAVLLEYWAAAKEHFSAIGSPLPPEAVIEQELFNITASTTPRWGWLYTSTTGQPPLYQQLRGTTPTLNAYLIGVGQLASLPTAQLERLLAEHIDLGNYRLDAWRLAPVVQRLAELRQDATTTHGSYLGAFSWLEDVRPTDLAEVSLTSVRNDPDNLGYIHAPSLTHGTAAALLRQGYKSRQLSANTTDPIAKRMAVDISSQRVRAAIALLEGLRAGQSLGALLGQDFERALQQYQSATSGLSLGRYVAAFRSTFPLVDEQAMVTGQAAPQGTPAEAAARQVLDGAALLRAAGRGFPYGVAGLSGQFAVNPDIVHPPQRSFTFTQRVLVQLPASVAAGVWPSVNTPRAAAAPRLNAWLKQFFPNPQQLLFSLGYWSGSNWIPQRQASLYATGLQPIDLLYLLDEKSLQTGSGFDQLASAGLGVFASTGNAVSLGATVINYADSTGAQALQRVLPLLARLRRLLGSARPARPHDLQAPSRLAEADEAIGIDHLGLNNRINGSLQALKFIAAELADLSATPARQRTAIYGAALFGLAEAPPALAQGANLATTLPVVLKAVQGRLAIAEATGFTTVADTLEAAAALLGPDFRPDVEFSLSAVPQTEYSTAVAPAASSALLAHHAGQSVLEEWLHGLGAVREPLNHLDKVFLIQSLLDSEGPAALPLQVAQLSPTTTPGGDFWLGLTWPTTYSPPAGVLSLAPQSLLLVVSPRANAGNWTTEDLLGAVNETLDLAKKRTVEPDALAFTHLATVLPAIVAPVARQAATFTLDFGQINGSARFGTPTLIAANRLESRPRSDEFNRALRAEIRDPLWLLARQWQMREFRAEDRGAPAFIEAAVQELPLSQLSFPGGTSRTYDSLHQPLEAAVEAQPRPIGAGLRLQMGQYWLRELRALPSIQAATATNRAAALGLFALIYPLSSQTATTSPVGYALEVTDAETHALLQLASPFAFDGYAFYQALLAPFRVNLGAALTDSELLDQALATLPLTETLTASPPFTNPATPAIAASVTAYGSIGMVDLNTLTRNFILAFHRLYLLGADSSSWSTENMAYSFTTGTAGAVGLGTTHYTGSATLPWFAVDQRSAPVGSPPTPVTPTSRRLLATEVRFPGSPSSRWWEFEDHRVDLGKLSGDPSDWGRMLLQEFMFLYQDDWFTVPYSVNTGSVSTVQSLRVTDVFGIHYAIQPAGAGQLTEPGTGVLIDNDENRWRLFAQTDSTHTGPATTPQLYVPAAVLSPLVSQPVEQINFHREEATNLVWAVENVVPDGFAGGLDGGAAAVKVAETLSRLTPTPLAGASPTAGTPDYAYQLASSVPENWLPFVPITNISTNVAMLEQGVFERQVPGLILTGSNATIQPRTALLQLHPNAAYRLHEHEVPPTGMRVEANCYRARWYGGRTLHWLGRQRGPARFAVKQSTFTPLPTILMATKTREQLLEELAGAVRSNGQSGKTTAQDLRTFLTSLIDELLARTDQTDTGIVGNSGGYQEVDSMEARDTIMIGEKLHLDGLGSGNRRLGMLVVVTQEENPAEWKTWRLAIPSFQNLDEHEKLERLASNEYWAEVVALGKN